MADMGSQTLIYVGRDDDLHTLLACFHSNKVSHVPVVDSNKLVGMVSKTDVTDFLLQSLEDSGEISLGNFCRQKKVKEVMIQPVIDAQVDDTTMTILEKMISHQISSVVLKDGPKLAGIVTDKDMLLYLTGKWEGQQPLNAKITDHIVAWLDKNGVFQITKALSDIGI
ncbi:MAG: CBS domain-containing protein [Bdellovibrionales bacterium]|nr:CBS domain-containing protein [Bdellovibrionales bacterium]